MEKKAAFVVGANGELGGALINELKRIGFTTIGTTRQEAETTADYTLHAPDLTWESNEKLNNELDKLLLEEGLTLEFIIELAGFGWQDGKLSDKKKDEMITVNIDMPIYWSEAKSNVHHILFSTCAVYGVQGTIGLTFYSDTKRKVENQMVKNCEYLHIVRPTLVETKFAERAGIPAFSTRGFPSPQKVAKTVVREAIEKNKKLVLPGYQAKWLHLCNCISPKLAQKFLLLKV